MPVKAPPVHRCGNTSESRLSSKSNSPHSGSVRLRALHPARACRALRPCCARRQLAALEVAFPTAEPFLTYARWRRAQGSLGAADAPRGRAVTAYPVPLSATASAMQATIKAGDGFLIRTEPLLLKTLRIRPERDARGSQFGRGGRFNRPFGPSFARNRRSGRDEPLPRSCAGSAGVSGEPIFSSRWTLPSIKTS